MSVHINIQTSGVYNLKYALPGITIGDYLTTEFGI